MIAISAKTEIVFFGVLGLGLMSLSSYLLLRFELKSGVTCLSKIDRYLKCKTT